MLKTGTPKALTKAFLFSESIHPYLFCTIDGSRGGDRVRESTKLEIRHYEKFVVTPGIILDHNDNSGVANDDNFGMSILGFQ